MENLKEELATLDKQADEAIKGVTQGKLHESLTIIQKSLMIRQEVYGLQSDEYIKTAEKLCEIFNMLSMMSLQKEKFDSCISYLKKAELLFSSSDELKAVTFNNYACYYRRIGKLRIAEKYLLDALSIENQLEKPQKIADTHLNLCAVYSQIGKHDLAIEQIRKSIILLQDEFMTYANEGENKIDKKEFEDRVSVLSIAYHNLGVECEHLHNLDEALNAYKKAVSFSKQHLGGQHEVVQDLSKVLERANKQISEIQKKAEIKRLEKEMKGLSKNSSTSSVGLAKNRSSADIKYKSSQISSPEKEKKNLINSPFKQEIIEESPKREEKIE